MEKIDLKQELRHLYNPSREKVSVADVPQMTFLMLDGLGDLRFEKFEEGKTAQIMHIGPYSEEGPTMATIHSFIEERGNLGDFVGEEAPEALFLGCQHCMYLLNRALSCHVEPRRGSRGMLPGYPRIAAYAAPWAA